MATLSEFVAAHSVAVAAAGGGGPAFEVQNERILQVSLGGAGGLEFVWMKMGSMVAHTGGGVKFKREGVMEHGLMHAMKKAVSSEGADLVRASAVDGRPAALFLADRAKTVVLLRLAGDSLVVNGNDLLAFEPAGIKHKIAAMRSLSAAASAGLFSVRLDGHGFVAVLAHGRPVTLPVAPGLPPVFTDPQATVAWSGDLTPAAHVDVGLKTLLGRGSGESFQMKFAAAAADARPGFVIVQPYEEDPATDAAAA